jgi:DNA-binding PadR family transcriptional regulator
MSVRLVLLGLLQDGPKYGYELKQIIEEHMGDWTSIAFGSIYFALDKLSNEKFIEKVGVEQSGSRPSRSVYELTQSGRDEFYQMLRQSWQTTERQYFDLDICLFFMDHLSREEIHGYLEHRKQELARQLGYLNVHEIEQMSDPQIPPQARAIFSHSRMHIQAEYDWVQQVLIDLDLKT